MTGHHTACPVKISSGTACGCSCHTDTHDIEPLYCAANEEEKDDTMAQRVQVLLTDDLDGSEAAGTLLFGLDGATYEIDLNEANEGKLREALAPYLGAARRTGGRRGAKPVRRMGGAKTPDTAEIRAWAKEKGYDVNDRGRVPATIREAYEKAQAA
jgi:hypothetical protein